MTEKNKGRLRVAGLIFDFRESHNAQLHIMREKPSDLPHLTINWGNPSKRINLHITLRKKGGEAIKEDLGTIEEVALINALSILGHGMISTVLSSGRNIRKIRPGWLGRKGYRIVLYDEGSEERVLGDAAPMRRYHGKNERYITSESFEKYVSSVEEDKIFLHPSILHDLKARGDGTADSLIEFSVGTSHILFRWY